MEPKHNTTETIKELIAVFRKWHDIDTLAAAKDEPRVKIHETIGKVAYVYEKIRVAIDYQEEHLIRKNAIARMLKRRLTIHERGSIIALPLIQEMIRAGYLKNNYFPANRIGDIENIIGKYMALINQLANNFNFQEKNKIQNWLISVASYEIEEYLSPTTTDDALVECMYKIIRPQLDLTAGISSPEDHDIQIYIAIHRALIKSDQAILRYHLVYYYAPDWRYITPAEIPAFALKLNALIERIETQLNNKTSDTLYRYMKKFSPLFIVLKDVIRQNPQTAEQLISDPKSLEEAVRSACQKRYREASVKLSRGVFRSIIYIFLTKTIMAFALELPYEALFLKQIRLLPLAVNVIFHPTLMFLIATSMRVPAEKNTQKIVQGIKEIIYNPPEKEILKKRVETLKTGGFLNFIFSAFYFIAFVITFGGIIWLLRTLHFSAVSAVLFLFFLCVISFFGLRLRQTAKELVILDRKEGGISIVFDFFALPVLRAGRWISRKTSKVNVFMYILDFIIEAPFKVMIETVEEWVAFQREKKDEVY